MKDKKVYIGKLEVPIEIVIEINSKKYFYEQYKFLYEWVESLPKEKQSLVFDES